MKVLVNRYKIGGTHLAKTKKIGILTPSSNIIMEPVCSKMLASIPEVSCHFSRFKVTNLSLDQDSLNQFQYEPILRAAELLADAQVDIIAWGGTSGGWLGLDVDRELCSRITKLTGIPAITSMSAQLDAFSENALKSCHLITPYIRPINDLIVNQYKLNGIETVNVLGCGETDNIMIGQISDERIENMIQSVSLSESEGISIVCTNFPAINSIDYFEKRYNLTIYDSIAVMVWKSIKLLDLDTDRVKGWGRLFNLRTGDRN
jgi:maleate isomerase